MLVIELDRHGRRAKLVRHYTHPKRLLAPFMGNAQLLPNGDIVVGWGGLPYVTEFRRDGSLRFDARLPAGGQNYRAFRLPWVGRPHDAPRLVSHRAAGRRLLYASWNGATEAVAWRLDAGATRDALQPVLTKPKRGFETSLSVPKGRRFAAAVALDAQGGVLGRSQTLRL